MFSFSPDHSHSHEQHLFVRDRPPKSIITESEQGAGQNNSVELGANLELRLSHGAISIFKVCAYINGAKISFGTIESNAAGEYQPGFENDTVTANIKLDPEKMNSDEDYAIAAAHEGYHYARDERQFRVGGFVEGTFATKYHAYTVSSIAAQAFGKSTYSMDGDGGAYSIGKSCRKNSRLSAVGRKKIAD